MPSKTPKFDALLDQIFETLVPHERVCGTLNKTGERGCGQVFNIEEDDIVMLKKLRVPPPTLCPRCIIRNQMAQRIRLRPTFYKRQCQFPGHKENIITFYCPENSVIVYDEKIHRSDSWDAINFGQQYDSDQSVLVQLKALIQKTPHNPLQNDLFSTNSEYSVAAVKAKNCYYNAIPYLSENLYYGVLGVSSKDCVDLVNTDGAENCYEVTRVNRSFGCSFCVDCSDCVDSYFLYDCRNCTNCFGCINLRNASYYWFNENIGKQEYEIRIRNLDLGSYNSLVSAQLAFSDLIKKAIRKNLDNIKVQNCYGNQIRESTNCLDTFEVFDKGENLRHVSSISTVSDMMSLYAGGTSSLAYNSSGISGMTNVKMSHVVRVGHDVEYSWECSNVEYCFGCVDLKNKKFCVFNKQYLEDDYWPLVDIIKTDMLSRGEYGEFFPIKSGSIPYNDSDAQIEFPLTREEVLARGWDWHDKKESVVDLTGLEVVKTEDLPDNIRDVSNDILHRAILCKESGRPFRLTSYELKFYREHNLPLPHLHPDVRIAKLLEYRLPYRLFDDTCKKCGVAMKSGYDPAKNYNVYCEECYKQAVL